MGYLYTVIVVLAVFHTGQSLSCWKCQSEDDRNFCADHFNTTRIQNLPRSHGSIDIGIPSEEYCENLLSLRNQDQKAVCIKKIEIIGGKRHYTRKCEFIHVELPVGECSKEAIHNNRIQLEYCQQCDTDLCNSSNMPSSSIYWSILASIISLSFLKH